MAKTAPIPPKNVSSFAKLSTMEQATLILLIAMLLHSAITLDFIVRFTEPKARRRREGEGGVGGAVGATAPVLALGRGPREEV